MDYEVWVKVDTIDFGQSEWSESLYFSTPATSDSEDTDIQQLIDEIEDMYLYYDQAITAIENRTAEEKDYVFSTFEDLYDNQIKIIENVDTTKSNELEADLQSLESRLQSEELDGSVWFHTTRTSNMDVLDTTEYDGDYYKIVNYDGSYDSDTDSDTFHTDLVSNGVFTCPLSGTYEFHFMGLSSSGGSNFDEVKVLIMAKSNSVSFTVTHGGLASGCPQNSNGWQNYQEDMSSTTQTGDVRCCSYDGGSCESETIGCFTLTFSEAQQKCSEFGMRLCTEEELFTNICCSSGCSFDYEGVWFRKAQVLSGTKTSDMDHKLTLSATAIVELEHGDTVWVETSQQINSDSAQRIQFTGELINYTAA
jgi:hypothetical protein